MGDFCCLYNSLLKPGETPVHPDEFFAKPTGGQMDHAPDQGLVDSLFGCIVPNAKTTFKDMNAFLQLPALSFFPSFPKHVLKKWLVLGGRMHGTSFQRRNRMRKIKDL